MPADDRGGEKRKEMLMKLNNKVEGEVEKLYEVEKEKRDLIYNDG